MRWRNDVEKNEIVAYHFTFRNIVICLYFFYYYSAAFNYDIGFLQRRYRGYGF